MLQHYSHRHWWPLIARVWHLHTDRCSLAIWMLLYSLSCTTQSLYFWATGCYRHFTGTQSLVLETLDFSSCNTIFVGIKQVSGFFRFSIYIWHLSHVLCEAYEQGLADSEFCLAPRGSRVWSPRLFEMIWFGCIPATQMQFGCCTWTWQLSWNVTWISRAHSDSGCAWFCRLKINFQCENYVTMKQK